MNRVDASLLAGGAAAVLTWSIPLWRDSNLVYFFAAPVSLGLAFASLPYGGPHEAALTGPLIIMASIINGVLWVSIVRAVCWLRDFVRGLRS